MDIAGVVSQCHIYFKHDKYCIHCRNLKFITNLGIDISKVHNILSFKQTQWLKPHIAFNTKNEKDARKQFQVQKAFNLAAAITNTAMAVTGALTAGGNPIKLATGMQFVEAGIAATVGAANIIKISNSKFGGGGSGGGGNDTNVPTGAAPMTANFNTIGSSGINQLAQLQQTPTQAYVVSGEVTSAQALDRNRVQNATL